MYQMGSNRDCFLLIQAAVEKGTLNLSSFVERLSQGFFCKECVYRRELLNCLFQRLFWECVYRRELLDCPL